MHACGVIDTACLVWCVIDTACTIKCSNNFKKWKAYAKRQCYAKKIKSVCTIDERFERPWKPLKGISIKNIYVPELSYPTPWKIYSIKCHWHRMHDFCVRKSIISRRIWSRIQKGLARDSVAHTYDSSLDY
jgi:hypothetical protein